MPGADETDALSIHIINMLFHYITYTLIKKFYKLKPTLKHV